MTHVRRVAGGANMLILFGVLITLAIFIFPSLRMFRDRQGAQLGWMSERWLLEFRASQLP